MENMGGGGHINMAGAQVSDKTIEEVKDMVRKQIDDMLQEGEK